MGRARSSVVQSLTGTGAEMVGCFEKLFGALQDPEARFRWRVIGTAGLACFEAGMTMLTGYALSQILHANL